MADDLSKRGQKDRYELNIKEPYDVHYWLHDLGDSEEQLRSAVAKAGPRLDDVKAHLQIRD